MPNERRYTWLLQCGPCWQVGEGWVALPRIVAPKAKSRTSTATRLRLRQQRMSLLLTERARRSLRGICSAYEHGDACESSAYLLSRARPSPVGGHSRGSAQRQRHQYNVHCVRRNKPARSSCPACKARTCQGIVEPVRTLQMAMQCHHEARDERNAADRAAQGSESVASTSRCSRAAGPRDAGGRAADFASATVGCPTSIQHQSARLGQAPASSAVLSTECAI